jgi:hypothetical protein
MSTGSVRSIDAGLTYGVALFRDGVEVPLGTVSRVEWRHGTVAFVWEEKPLGSAIGTIYAVRITSGEWTIDAPLEPAVLVEPRHGALWKTPVFTVSVELAVPAEIVIPEGAPTGAVDVP